VSATARTSQERLLLSCHDQPGIVAAITTFLARAGANIAELDQYSDLTEERFAIRVVYTPPRRADYRQAFEYEVASTLENAQYGFASLSERPRVAILCSRQDHCLMDLLWRFTNQELPGELTEIVSTVSDHTSALKGTGIPYHVMEVKKNAMADHEAQLLALLGERVQLIVLARYMRILSANFLEEIACPIINIHHSFLPAFVGAEAYAHAHTRGVKLIGATAHYVTPELDQGPIIEQDVARITHRDGIEDLRRIGRDVERLVLARAVRAHLEDRVVVFGGRTVVFGG